MVTSPTTSNVISSFPDRKPRREDFLRESEFMEVLVDLPMETKKKIGYELYEMVLSCGYENHKCNMSEFSWFFDAVYGNCYVFNSGWLSQQTSYPAKRPGRSKGLRMTFNLGQHEYLSGIARSAGIVVVVHPQTRMPFPEDEGVFAAPGYLTSIGLNKVSISRLPHPYGNCSEKTRNPLINVYEEDYNVEYSSLACYKTCYQKYVTQRCNCSDPQYPSKGQTFGGKNWTACSVRDIKQDDCLYGVTHDYISNTLICNCPTPCRETTYRYSVSRSQWPSQAYMNDFMKQHTGSLGNLRNHSSIDSFVQSNIVSVEVYFNEFNYQSISEKPGYPIHIYLADGCSILGLWLGMSLFSLTEVIELAADLVIVTCCKNKKKFNQIVISGVNYQEAPVKHVPVVTITQSRRLPTFPAKVQWTQYANKSGNNITSRRISNRGKMKDNMDMRDRQNISTKY